MAAGSRWRPVLLFLLMLALFPAVGSLATWLRGEAMQLWDWLGLIALPPLAWLWLRYFSVFACRRSCLPREQSGK